MAFRRIYRLSLIFPSNSSTRAAESQISGFFGLDESADFRRILAFLTSPMNSESNLWVLSSVIYPTLSTLDLPVTELSILSSFDLRRTSFASWTSYIFSPSSATELIPYLEERRFITRPSGTGANRSLFLFFIDKSTHSGIASHSSLVTVAKSLFKSMNWEVIELSVCGFSFIVFSKSYLSFCRRYHILFSQKS